MLFRPSTWRQSTSCIVRTFNGTCSVEGSLGGTGDCAEGDGRTRAPGKGKREKGVREVKQRWMDGRMDGRQRMAVGHIKSEGTSLLAFDSY